MEQNYETELALLQAMTLDERRVYFQQEMLDADERLLKRMVDRRDSIADIREQRKRVQWQRTKLRSLTEVSTT